MMSNPLFLGLIVAGVALVVGVVLLNWIQERRVRRRIDAAFRKPGDADNGNGRDRVEPRLAVAPTPAPAGPALEEDAAAAADSAAAGFPADSETPPVPAPAERSASAPDPEIECVMRLLPTQPVPTAALGGALAHRGARPIRWLGRRGEGLPWQAIDGAASGPWHELVATMLLANRAGAASRADLDGFAKFVAQVAAGLPAAVELPDATAEAGRAEALDRLCADLDVQIGLTILKGDVGQIVGTRLRGVAEAAGFRLTPAGQFDYVQDETGSVLYSLQNYKQEPFTAESLRVLTTPGVVFLLDVPRVADAVRVFDQMRLAAKRMAQTLEGVLVDDNRRPLDDAALAAIRGQVQQTAAALREAHIDPGGPRALRLFG